MTKKIKKYIINAALLFFGGLSLLSPAHAQSKDLTVFPAEKRLYAVEPRQVISIPFLITNNGVQNGELTGELILPEGWQPIVQEEPYSLPLGNTGMRLISFFVPQGTPAGHYMVSYRAQSQLDAGISEQYEVPVEVLPVVNLDIQKQTGPDIIIAGETYSIDFQVVNESNSENLIEYKINSSIPYEVILPKTEDRYLPGEAKIIKVTIVSDKNEKHRQLQVLNLKASLKDNPSKTVTVQHAVEIVPLGTGKIERFHKIPSVVTTRVLSSYNSTMKPKNFSAVQMEVSGSGTLDEAGNHTLDYLVRTPPDARQYSLYGTPDEYLINYRSRTIEASVGDQVYNITPLIDSFRYGRGASAKVNLGNVTLSGGTLKTRWLDPELKEDFGSVTYNVDEKNSLEVNYVKKQYQPLKSWERFDTTPTDSRFSDEIVGLRAKLSPFRNVPLNIYGEYAAGKKDKAYMAEISGAAGKTLYDVKLIHAGPQFYGYYNNMDFQSAYLSVPLHEKLRLNVNYRDEKNNLNLNPYYNSAPWERFATADLEYRYSNNASIGLEYRFRQYQDRLPEPLFNYRSTTLGIRTTQTFKKLNLFGVARFGKTKDYLTGENYHFTNCQLSVTYAPSSKYIFGGYVEYNNEREFLGSPTRRISGGVNLNAELSPNTRLYFNYRRDLSHRYAALYPSYSGYGDSWLYPDQWIKYRRNLFELSFRHTLKNGNYITFRGRKAVFTGTTGFPLNQNETDIMLEYSIPFGLPVSKKTSVGFLKGTITDAETGEGIPNLLLRVGQVIVVTDSQGRFNCMLKPGIYFLTLDRSRLSLDRTTAEQMPMKIEITGGQDTTVNLTIVANAMVTGKVKLYRFEQEGVLARQQDTDLIPASGLPDCQLELTNGKETRHTVTDSEGNFRFRDLSPGIWTLVSSPENLPDYCYFEQEKIEIIVEPGKATDVTVKVLPREREIKIQKPENEIIIEEEIK